MSLFDSSRHLFFPIFLPSNYLYNYGAFQCAPPCMFSFAKTRFKCSNTTPRPVTTPLFLINTVMVISPKTLWSHGFVKSPRERPHCVGEIKSFLSHLTWHIPWHSTFGKMNCWISRICHGILFLPICFRVCHGILFLFVCYLGYWKLAFIDFYSWFTQL